MTEPLTERFGDLADLAAEAPPARYVAVPGCPSPLHGTRHAYERQGCKCRHLRRQAYAGRTDRRTAIRKTLPDLRKADYFLARLIADGHRPTGKVDPPTKRAAAIRMSRKHHSHAAIAEHLGVTVRTVERYLTVVNGRVPKVTAHGSAVWYYDER